MECDAFHQAAVVMIKFHRLLRAWCCKPCQVHLWVCCSVAKLVVLQRWRPLGPCQQWSTKVWGCLLVPCTISVGPYCVCCWVLGICLCIGSPGPQQSPLHPVHCPLCWIYVALGAGLLVAVFSGTAPGIWVQFIVVLSGLVWKCMAVSDSMVGVFAMLASNLMHGGIYWWCHQLFPSCLCGRNLVSMLLCGVASPVLPQVCFVAILCVIDQWSFKYPVKSRIIFGHLLVVGKLGFPCVSIMCWAEGFRLFLQLMWEQFWDDWVSLCDPAVCVSLGDIECDPYGLVVWRKNGAVWLKCTLLMCWLVGIMM